MPGQQPSLFRPPGLVPDVQPSGEGDVSAASDSEGDQQSVTGSLSDESYWYGSPDRDLPREEAADQELSEEANYRETMRGVRSFMGWHKIPEFKTVSSSDDSPFAGTHTQPTAGIPVNFNRKKGFLKGYFRRKKGFTSEKKSFFSPNYVIALVLF